MHGTPRSSRIQGVRVEVILFAWLGPVVSASAADKSVLAFKNFSLRCDKSDKKVFFEKPWDWSFSHGSKIAVITKNHFLRYQLNAALSGLVPPATGEVIGNGVIGWPVGGEGGLDKNLRISHAVDFLSNIYEDCLEKSGLNIDEFWALLAGAEVYPDIILKDLKILQKKFFYLSLSVLFSFDLYLIPNSKYLMSKDADPLRKKLLMQLQGKSLFSTSTSRQFQNEFCNEGLVLGSMGQILYAGPLRDSLLWADQNLKLTEVQEAEDNELSLGLDLINSVHNSDENDDLI